MKLYLKSILKGCDWMQWMAKFLIVGDIITLNRHAYRILSISKGIGVYTMMVESVRYRTVKEALFYPSEFVSVKKDSEIVKNERH
ncbi:hypothetical protein I532_03985 [Brevibacillus borstelensis AK1]|uniref:Uncharacterized protein n=1 Tax=Brevibacillus borstelensis AK1 TaxID=1300222 RepID=M8EGZ3_9BACL|nr:hypothetical protein I532_03985 [Brevibacillus borstelensis AK1]